MTPLISLQKISKTFFQGTQRIEVLNLLNLKVQPGESIAVLGKSGSGKSTLLSILAGLDDPEFGNISINGQDLSALSQNELSQFRAQNLGIVFQQYHLMNNLTTLENVSLPLELQKADNYDSRSREALEQVGLSQRLTHFPTQLSGGEANVWPLLGPSSVNLPLFWPTNHPETLTTRLVRRSWICFSDFATKGNRPSFS